MKGTEYARATTAIDRVVGLKHYRPETVHAAVGAVLAFVGARRVLRVGTTDNSPDRRLLTMLSEVEASAVRLDALSPRVEHMDERATIWRQICAGLMYVSVLLDVERKAARGEHVAQQGVA